MPRKLFRGNPRRPSSSVLPMIMPGLVCPTGPWTVHYTHECMGTTNPSSRLMTVCDLPTPQGRSIRNHENAHARFSPMPDATKALTDEGITLEAIEACEEFRVEKIATLRGVEVGGVLTKAELKIFRKVLGLGRIGERRIAGFALASLNQRLKRSASNALRKAGYGDTLEACRRIARLMVKQGVESIEALRRGALLFDATFSDMLGQHKTVAPPKPGDKPGGRHKHTDDPHHTVKWGSMTVCHPTLTKRYTPQIRQRSHRSTFGGASVRRIDRLCFATGRAFRRRVSRPGGTVLLDASSSMGVTQKTIDRVLSELPAATIALYASAGHDVDTDGALVVVAEGGRMIPWASYDGDERRGLLFGGNVVDGPALVWLGLQAEPRFWVTDGGVTGIGDDHTPQLIAQAQVLEQRGNVKRIHPRELKQSA